MQGGSVVSQDSRRAPQSAPGSQRQRPCLTCNLCRKPLSTTFYVCACDCLFCEECTYSHFNQSSNCPTCNKVLGENDFTELVVADPSPSSDNSNIQTFFKKQNRESQTLAYQDVCMQILKQVDLVRSGSKLLMKQFLQDSNRFGQRSGNMIRAMESMKKEITSLKQAHNSLKMSMEQMAAEYQQKLQIAQKKLEEKDRQLMQFRKIHNSMTPMSPHGTGVGDQQQQQQQRQQQQQGVMAPPMQGFMKQKEAKERVQQHALNQSQRGPIARVGPAHATLPRHNTTDSGGRSYITPMPMVKRPYSTQPGAADMSRTRDMRSNQGFSLESTGHDGDSQRINKRRKGLSPLQVGQSSFSSPRGTSPNMAFALQHQGTVPRGPTAYFQNYGHR